MSEKVSKSFETPFPILPMPSPKDILACFASSKAKTVQSAPISKEKTPEKQPVIKKPIVSRTHMELKHEVPLKEVMEENKVINYRRRPTVNLRGQTKSSERNELKDTQRWKEYVDDSKLIAPGKNVDDRKLVANGKSLASQPKIIITNEVVAKPSELKLGKLGGSEKGPQLRQRAEPKEVPEEIFEEKEEGEESKKVEEKPRGKRGRPPKNKNIVNKEEIKSPNIANEKGNSKEQKRQDNIEVQPKRESQRLKSKTPSKYLDSQEEKPAEEVKEKNTGKLDESLKNESVASGINSEDVKPGKNDQVYIICKECLRKKVKVPARYVENNAELDEEDYFDEVYKIKKSKTPFKNLEKKSEPSSKIEIDESFEDSKKPGGMKNMEIEEPVVQSKEKNESKNGQVTREKKPLEKLSDVDLPNKSVTEVIRKSITPPIRTTSNKVGFEEKINLSPRKKSYSRINEERLLKDLKKPEVNIGKKSKTPPIRALKFPDSEKKEEVEDLIEKQPSLTKKSQSPKKSFAEQDKEQENQIESEGEDNNEQKSIKNMGKTDDNESYVEEIDECDCPSDEEDDLLKKNLDPSVEDTRSKTNLVSLAKSKSKTPLQSLEKPKSKTPEKSLEKTKVQSKSEIEIHENSIQMNLLQNLLQKKQEDKEEIIENESEDGFVSQFLEKNSKSKSPIRKSFEIFQSKVESAMNKEKIVKPSEEKKNKSLSQIKRADQKENIEKEDDDESVKGNEESADFSEKEDEVDVKKTSLKKSQSPVKRSLNKSKTPLKRVVEQMKEKEVSKDEKNKEEEEAEGESKVSEEKKEELFDRKNVDKKKSKTPVRSPEAIVVHVDQLPEEKTEKDFIIVEDIVHHSQLQEPMEIEKEEGSEKREVIVSESAIKHEGKKGDDDIKDSGEHENNKNEKEEEKEKLDEALNDDKKEKEPKEKLEENNDDDDDDKDGIPSNKKKDEKLKASQIPASQDSAYRPKEYRTKSKIWIDKPINIDNSLRFENSLPAETTVKKEKTIRKPAAAQPTKKKVSFESEKKEPNFENDQNSLNRPKKIPEEMAKLMRKKIPPANENKDIKIGKKPLSENVAKSVGKKPINENVMRNVRESCKKGLENMRKDIPKKKGKK